MDEDRNRGARHVLIFEQVGHTYAGIVSDEVFSGYSQEPGPWVKEYLVHPSFQEERNMSKISGLEAAVQRIDQLVDPWLKRYHGGEKDDKRLNGLIDGAGLAKKALEALLEEERDKPHVGDGTPDAALAIGEEALRFGFNFAFDKFAPMSTTGSEQMESENAAWDAYEPSEAIKDLS